MNGPLAFCPRCRKDVMFVDAGPVRRCTVCGSEFQRTEAHAGEPNLVGAVVMTVGHVLLRLVLILGVILLVGIAVLFASCALRL